MIAHAAPGGAVHGGPINVCSMMECQLQIENAVLQAQNERLREAPFVCETHACGECRGCRAAGVRDLITQYGRTIDRVRALATSWAEQPTDYDEDTERQIEDGRELLALLDGMIES